MSAVSVMQIPGTAKTSGNCYTRALSALRGFSVGFSTVQRLL
jgi:hypothetical protein